MIIVIAYQSSYEDGDYKNEFVAHNKNITGEESNIFDQFASDLHQD